MVARDLESLVVTQGRHAGQPFPVLPWEKRFIRGAFAPDVLDAGLSIGRGNGKTTLTAGIATTPPPLPSLFASFLG